MHDMIVVGAGPVGLALAASLAREGCTVALVERESAARLAAPAFDGREIALTRSSRDILTRLGAWARLPQDEIHPLRSANVLNGVSPRAMVLHPASGGDRLGDLVPNMHIRAALHAEICCHDAIALIAGDPVAAVHTPRGRDVGVVLQSGRILRGRVLVAADSRLSAMRRHVGIGADIERLPKTMLLFRVSHSVPHAQIATEWFAHDMTIATLPLSQGVSSIVLTVPHDEARRLLGLGDGELAEHVQCRLGQRLGTLHIASSRHIYPLVVAYAHRFAKGRVALVGDAAVGMHPVTAHGFNFGLKGQALLAELLGSALRSRRPFAIERALECYAAEHRRSTRPLYLATNGLTRLFTAETPGSRLMRHGVIMAGARLAPLRMAIATMLR